MDKKRASKIIFEHEQEKQNKMISSLDKNESQQLLVLCMKLLRGEDPFYFPQCN